MPIEDLAARLNAIEELKRSGVTVSVEMIARYAAGLKKGTTLATAVPALLAIGFSLAALADAEGASAAQP